MDAQRMKVVYTITEREGGKSYWTRIGVGFVNQDGSINLRLDAVPVAGTIQVRDWEPRDRGDEASRGAQRAKAPSEAQA